MQTKFKRLPFPFAIQIAEHAKICFIYIVLRSN